MSNVRVISVDELANAPELELGIGPCTATAAPLLDDLPVRVSLVDLDAGKAVAARLDSLEPAHAAQIVRWLVTRYLVERT